MGIKVGINGFGRIGRVVFRTCMENPDIEVTALNDPAINVDYITYLIKFDSTHGKFKGSVINNQTEVIVNGMTIKVFSEELPECIPWDSAEVRYVVEASGMFTSYDKASMLGTSAFTQIAFKSGYSTSADTAASAFKASMEMPSLPAALPFFRDVIALAISGRFGGCVNIQERLGHLCSKGVRRVVVAAPSADVPMIVLGVNHKRMTSDLSVVSGASSTLYCLAPIIKVLDDNFGLSEGFVTSIHAMTPSLKPLDGLCMRGRHWRDHRSIHQNIIPANTGACKALGKILPKTKDKLAGIAFRVPIVDVSALDITVRLAVNTTLQSIIKCVEQASATNLKCIIKTSNEGAVSSDFIGDSFSCILDVESCIQLRPNFYKLICWYENEYSYANRILNTITMSEEISLRPMKPIKMGKIKPKKQVCRGKGDPPTDPSDEYITSTSSKGMAKRAMSPDYPLSPRARKKTDESKIWNEFSSAKPSSSAPVKQNKTGFSHNLVSATASPAVAKLSPECLQKLDRDFSKPSNRVALETMDPPKTLQRSPERNDATDAKCKVTQLSKERHKGAKQRKNLSPVQRDRCDNIQMAAVLRNMPLDPKTSSSHCLDINIVKERNVKKCYSFGKVSSDCTVTMRDNETNHKMPTTGKLPSHKNDIERDQNIVTEIETHPIRSMSPRAIVRDLSIPETKTEDTVCQSDVVDDTLAKTIDFFVDGLTQDQMFLSLMDDKNSKKPNTFAVLEKQDQCKDSTPQVCRPENALAERICDMAELVRFVEVPRKESKKSKRTDSNRSKRGQPELDAEFLESSTIYKESETESVNLEETSGKRSTLIIDMQQQYDGPETECAYRSDDEETLSEVEPTRRVSSALVSTCAPKRHDIYDKVESTSVTDSDNSFYVRERRSEVIQLTDLTRGTSLDDLVKLDKICRIMEISDELSDKLFSALPKGEAARLGDKWSFKELCEKIKFDEFCEAVFDR